eukprot:366131-Chlamydomonas_euryale.AAC.6
MYERRRLVDSRLPPPSPSLEGWLAGWLAGCLTDQVLCGSFRVAGLASQSLYNGLRLQALQAPYEPVLYRCGRVSDA